MINIMKHFTSWAMLLQNSYSEGLAVREPLQTLSFSS